MSRRRSARLVFAAVALVASATVGSAGATGQEPTSSPTEEELLRRIESLRPVLEEARTAMESAERQRELDEAARPRRATEIVRVGPLRILTLPEQAELAADLFGQVWREDFAGVTGSPALTGHLFVFQWAWRRGERLYIEPESTVAAPARRVELTRAWVTTRGAARSRIRDAVWAALRSDLPESSPLGSWVGSAGYPSAERVSRLVTTTQVDTHQACLEGDTNGCLTALGLAGGEMTVPPETPAMVLLEAIRLGGDGAWERLLEDRDAAPLDALAHAAGVDADAVVAEWRTSVLNERSEIHAGLTGQAGRVLLWVLALAAFAMRSTRWRLG
jgi:hypothetical protein